MKKTRFLMGLVRSVILVVAGLGVLGVASLAGAQTTINILGNRYPALEYYVKALGQAPGVKVESTLVPYDKAMELATLNLSSGSSAYDLIWLPNADAQNFASKGWLEPQDSYFAKYKDQYHFEDFSANDVKMLSYQGKLYALPIVDNLIFFFYRKDLLDAKGIKPPDTFDEYLQAAKALTTKDMYGTTLCLRRLDGLLGEFHYYLNARGGQWFDAKWKPTFNSPEGVKAVETLKEMMKYAPPGVTTYGNDECTIALQQGLVAMGMMYQGRASAMDDPKSSKVVGKMEWKSPPTIRKGVPAGSRTNVSGFGIAKSSKVDKDLLFRAVAYASSRESMRGAAKFGMPSRVPLLKDPELIKENRDWPAAFASLQEAQPFPLIPDFLDVAEGVILKVQQALAGELAPKPALDQAAKDAEDLLRSRGYYK